MAFQLPPLPYPNDALEPHIDAKTMEIHHDKHHAAYVNNLNAAIEGSCPTSEQERRGPDREPQRGAGRHPHRGPQQRRRPRQSLVLLGDHGPERRRRAERRAGGGDRARSRRLRRHSRRRSTRPAPADSAAAGLGWSSTGRQARRHAAPRTRTTRSWTARHADPRCRCLGARLLSEVPEPAPGLPDAWWNAINWDAVAKRYTDAGGK